jgi:toxin YoeB
MISNVRWSQKSLKDYEHWGERDRNIQDKIKRLIQSIKESPFQGIGKPEPLKHDLAGYWSRRVKQEHRLVYRVHEGALEIVSCRYHYS